MPFADAQNRKIGQSEEISKANRLLDVQLSHTTIDVDSDMHPFAIPSPDLRFSDFASLFPASEHTLESNAWRLCRALFDEIDLRLPPSAPPELVGSIDDIRRKLAVSKWLQAAVESDVDHHLLSTPDAGPARVFALLSGNQVEKAAEAALDAGDLRLATLVARAGGNPGFRRDVRLQLDRWRELGISAHIDGDYRKVYSVLAGVVGVSEGVRGRDTVEEIKEVVIHAGLDWKRAFGLQLWFGTPFGATLGDAVDAYESALADEKPPAAPLPWYQERPEQAAALRKWKTPGDAKDALYYLINLYTNSATPLEAVLDPSNFGTTPLDCRLPWHVYMILARTLKCRDFEDREESGMDDEDEDGVSAKAEALTRSYAMQLEVLGAWEKAAFVLLHLEVVDK